MARTRHPSVKRRGDFIERTLSTLAGRVERALSAEETAKSDGLLQRLDPRVKLAGVLALVVAVATSRSLTVIVCIFGLALTLGIFSRVSLGVFARAWLGALLFTGAIALPAIFIVPGRVVYRFPWLTFPVTETGLRSAEFLVARVETTLTLSTLIVLCTPWTDVLKALRALRVPIVAVVVVGMTYRYVFLLLRTTHDMFESRRSRMIGVLSGREKRRIAAASAGVLLTKTFHLSNEVYLAMQSRGFRGEVYTLDDFDMRARDWLALIAFGLAAALAILWGTWTAHQ
jgi:cobalt/nickel transport system permease protein